MKCLLLLVAIGVSSAYKLQRADWGYGANNGPSTWARSYPLCGGSSQSPLNLPAAEGNNPPPPTFTLASSWYSGPRTLDILNNGHTIEIEMPEGFEVAGGGLPTGADYTAAQFHFHWGSRAALGSEHTFSGRSYPLEMHVVTWDQTLGSFDNAKVTRDGLAVLGFVFQIGARNAAFQPIVEALSQVQRDGSRSAVRGMNVLALIESALNGGFYRYGGSLTTPTCNESVVWTNFMRTITISSDQLVEFTRVTGTSGGILVNNFRPPQRLNNRVVEQYGSA